MLKRLDDCRGNRLSKEKWKRDILASLKTPARTQQTFRDGKDFRWWNCVQVKVFPCRSAACTHCLWVHRSVCLQLAEQSWRERRQQAMPAPLHSPGDNGDRTWMLPKLTSSLEAKEPYAAVEEKGMEDWEKGMQHEIRFFNLLIPTATKLRVDLWKQWHEGKAVSDC